MSKDPLKCALWGVVVGNIESMGILPALQGGEAVVRCLPGDSPLEKLAQFEGEDNYDVQEKNGMKYYILKKCPFAQLYAEIPAWGERSMKLVEAYNRKSDGGGALHPLCLVHKGLRTSLKAGIISVACRSGATGKIEVAENALPKAGLTREEATSLVDGKACLFAMKT